MTCVCSVCGDELSTVTALHYHHVSFHTAEELSLSLIQIRRFDISAKCIQEAIDLSEYPRLCNRKLTNRSDLVTYRSTAGKTFQNVARANILNEEDADELLILACSSDDGTDGETEKNNGGNGSVPLIQGDDDADKAADVAALLGGLGLECNVESVDEIVKDEVQRPCSPERSLSPDNFPHAERHIETITSPIPHIVLPEDSKITYRENFVLSSPVAEHHYTCITNDYSNSIEIQEGKLGDLSFQEYFVPRVEYGSVDSKTDVSCTTNTIELTEKQVQTSVVDNDKGNTVEVSEETPNKTMQKEIITNKSDEIRSTTVQKLLLFRKVKKNKPPDNTPQSASTQDDPMPTFGGHPYTFKGNIYPFGLDDNRRFFCDLCGKGYKKKSHLERHLRVHTGERPFSCSFCEKRFAVRSILKQHIRIHTGEKPYACSICFQRFPQKSGLMTHTMLHTGKPFKCDLCDKSFVSKHKLLQHLRCHNNEQDYVCQICEVVFFTAGGFREHAKFHADRYEHSCVMCGATFLQESFLKMHLGEHVRKIKTDS